MTTVGVVANARYEGLGDVLATVQRLAAAAGVDLRSEPELAPFWPVPTGDLATEAVDRLLTFGGDGTLLRGARLLQGREIPVLGVNLGRVGFLTAATRDELESAVRHFLEGQYRVEARRVLTCRIEHRGSSARPLPVALNDVVVHKSGVARMIRLAVSVNGAQLGPFSADGLIVATPTGSTAYSLSAGGPVVVPGVEGILLTPICAHTLAVRPFVIPSSARVDIEAVRGWEADLQVSVDGQQLTTLTPEERVVLELSPHRIPLAYLEGTTYFSRLRRTLRWGDISERESGV